MDSSRSSVASDETGGSQDNLQSENMPQLKTLISYLVAAKRSLSSINHVWRANEIVTAARVALEESVTISSRTGFLRRGLNNQLRLLYNVRTEVEHISHRGRQDFADALKSLDAADAQLKSTLGTLTSTIVHASFRGDEEEPKSLRDFVDERGVEELHTAMKQSIDRTNGSRVELDASNKRFDDELQSIKQALRNYRSATRLASSRASASSSTSSNSDSGLLALSNMPSMLQALEAHAQEMAVLLEALVRHFDLCVTAVKHTEGGGAAARSITQDVPAQVQGTSDAMPHIGEEIHANLNAPLDPMTDAEYVEMVSVLMKDALEAEDVVAEIQDRILEMESIHERISAQRGALEAVSNATLEIHQHLSTLAITGLPQYISQAHNFTNVWNEEHDRIKSGLTELSNLHSLYEGFLDAYDSLILEVHRRSQIRSRVEKVLRDTRNKLNHLYEEDVAAREAFRVEQGDFLPSDIWPGISHAPMQVQFLRLAGGQLERVLENAQLGEPSDSTPSAARSINTGFGEGEIIPSLPKDVVEQAYLNLKERTRAFE
ncbi:Autophagy-related protein 17 [Penicillium ucsense]|uniref:Autophagy-related protein 17 n=1 Tax=Penicillium ucsense TaxID=2839758 RepID=A0A8J8WME5_9EURO|nr:Autophagy-related protein 17 [Penicillium ucsense]KAF7738778.1 Autophagy-related protein 17 [Penicillium ucsense]